MVKLHTEQNNSWSIRNLFNPQTPEQQTQSMMAAQMLTQFFQTAVMAASMYDYSTPATTTPARSNNNDDVEVLAAPTDENTPATEKTPAEKVAAFREFLTTMGVDKEITTHLEELAEKYDLLKTGHPDWNPDQIYKRILLCNSAMRSHDIQAKYGETYDRVMAEYIQTPGKDLENMTDEDFDEIARLCQEALNKAEFPVDIDEPLQEAVNNKEPGKFDDAAYLQGIINRGQGYVDMYDADGNGTIELNEFIALEEKDNRAPLSAEQRAATEEIFNMIDKDNSSVADKGHLSAKEMATYLFAISRLHDYDNNDGTNTAGDITFKEWHDAQQTKYLETLTGIRDSLHENQLFSAYYDDWAKDQK